MSSCNTVCDRAKPVEFPGRGWALAWEGEGERVRVGDDEGKEKNRERGHGFARATKQRCHYSKKVRHFA